MKKIHFEQYAVEKYYRVTAEVSQDINRIAVVYDNEGKSSDAMELRKVMEKVCSVNNDLENPDWDLDQLKQNAKIIKTAIDTIKEKESSVGEFLEDTSKLQGLYDCWKRLFGYDFDEEKEAE